MFVHTRPLIWWACHFIRRLFVGAKFSRTYALYVDIIAVQISALNGPSHISITCKCNTIPSSAIWNKFKVNKYAQPWVLFINHQIILHFFLLLLLSSYRVNNRDNTPVHTFQCESAFGVCNAEPQDNWLLPSTIAYSVQCSAHSAQL